MISKEEKDKIKLIVKLADQEKLKEALEIANSLSRIAMNMIPDSVLFKFSNLDEMSVTGGAANINPGTGMGVATKNSFKKKRKNYFTKKKFPPRSMRLSSLLNEISYNKFKNEARTKKQKASFHKINTPTSNSTKLLSLINEILKRRK